jgi:RsiW-degrading membrane proteinase PrsW (M82 family)
MPPRARAVGARARARLAQAAARQKASQFARLLGVFHQLVISTPVALPLVSAIVCACLLLIPQTQSPMRPPWLFLAVIILVVLSAAGVLVTSIAYDCVHSFYNLLPRPKPWKVALIACVGTSFAFLRLVHVSWSSGDRSDYYTTERLECARAARFTVSPPADFSSR